MWRKLHGRVVLITGASRGIGRCVAEQLASLGAKLILVARSRDALDQLAADLARQGAESLPVAADLTTADGRSRLIDAVGERFGRLDILINNAGLASFGEFATSSEEVLRRIMEINFFTPVELTRVCMPLLQRSASAAVVNVASICGRRGIPSFPEHCASKFALVGMTEALRAEFARFGVDVLLIIPGLVRADDLDSHLLRNEGQIDLDFAGAQRADAVARGIVGAIRWNRRETVVGWTARWVWRGRQFFPRFMDRLLARKVRKFRGKV